GGLDLGPRARADGVRLDRDLAADLAGPEHLDRTALAQIDQTVRVQHFQRDLILGDTAEVPQIHDLVLRAERVLEPALREPALQRHLPALEPGVHLPAGPGLLALVPPPARLAQPGARSAAHTLPRTMRTPRTPEIAQVDHDSSPPSTSRTSTRC